MAFNKKWICVMKIGIVIPVLMVLILSIEAAQNRNGKIAFTSDRDGNREIYVMNADGTGQVRLTNNAVVDDHPTWSPDGRQLAFLSQRPSGQFAIFVMKANSNGRTEVTPVNYPRLEPWNGWDGWSMSWSPDGRQIVFSDGITARTIVVADSDGTNRLTLTSGYAPSWAPDGSKILFLSSGFFGSRILTIRPDGNDLRDITPTLQFNYQVLGSPPVWSPDGLQFAFASSDSANSEINLANADGSNARTFAAFCDEKVPQGCSTVQLPAWSADGRTIAFVTLGVLSGREIYTQNLDYTGLTRLTFSAGIDSNPNWQALPACRQDVDRYGSRCTPEQN
jgi:Tol biopolymer transport system component